MTHTPTDPKISFQEAQHRNQTAREILRQIETALEDVPLLAEELRHLREVLSGARLDRANLAAAARATIAAHHDGEPDPLSYLREELNAQGFGSPS